MGDLWWQKFCRLDGLLRNGLLVMAGPQGIPGVNLLDDTSDKNGR